MSTCLFLLTYIITLLTCLRPPKSDFTHPTGCWFCRHYLYIIYLNSMEIEVKKFHAAIWRPAKVGADGHTIWPLTCTLYDQRYGKNSNASAFKRHIASEHPEEHARINWNDPEKQKRQNFAWIEWAASELRSLSVFDGQDFKVSYTINSPDCKVMCSKTARGQFSTVSDSQASNQEHDA